MKLDMQHVKNTAKVCCDHARMALGWADKKLSGIYAEYDVSADGKICLCPENTDTNAESNGESVNTLNTSCKGKIRFSAKDVLCFLAIFTVVFTLLKTIIKKMLK